MSFIWNLPLPKFAINTLLGIGVIKPQVDIPEKFKGVIHDGDFDVICSLQEATIAALSVPVDVKMNTTVEIIKCQRQIQVLSHSIDLNNILIEQMRDDVPYERLKLILMKMSHLTNELVKTQLNLDKLMV
jgi:hypothetical protein